MSRRFPLLFKFVVISIFAVSCSVANNTSSTTNEQTDRETANSQTTGDNSPLRKEDVRQPIKANSAQLELLRQSNPSFIKVRQTVKDEFNSSGQKLNERIKSYTANSRNDLLKIQGKFLELSDSEENGAAARAFFAPLVVPYEKDYKLKFSATSDVVAAFDLTIESFSRVVETANLGFTLIVFSDPSEAEVATKARWLDDSAFYTWNEPTKVRIILPNHTHTIKVKKTGYREERKEYNPNVETDDALFFKLTPEPAVNTNANS